MAPVSLIIVSSRPQFPKAGTRRKKKKAVISAIEPDTDQDVILPQYDVRWAVLTAC